MVWSFLFLYLMCFEVVIVRYFETPMPILYSAFKIRKIEPVNIPARIFTKASIALKIDENVAKL